MLYSSSLNTLICALISVDVYLHIHDIFITCRSIVMTTFILLLYYNTLKI